MNEAKGLPEKAKALSAGGMTYKNIADELNVPPLAIFAWVGDTGEDSAFARFARLRAKGLSNREIARRQGVQKDHVMKTLGPVPMPDRDYERRNIRIQQGSWPKLQAIALSLGFRVERGVYAGAGDVGSLIDAIVRGDVTLSWRPGRGPMLDVITGE